MTTTTADETLERLGRLLDRAVRELGDAGQADSACRIAAEAWWLVREPAPRAARRLNATLHYLTVQPGKHAHPDREETPCPPTPTRSSTSAASRPPGGTS